MRAGCFAERRVIDLINRRFVPFFFNRGGPGKGRDAKASAFVDGQTENPWAYFAAFSPDGRILGETELYADKDAVFEWLRELLADHPEYAKAPAGEAETAPSRGALLEELGDYDGALAAYAATAGEPAVRLAARLGELRIARYRADWPRHAELEEGMRGGEHAEAAAVDLELERGRRMLAEKNYTAARDLLQPLTQHAAGHPRLAEVHFYAGVACWFDDDRDWAKLHWCWVVENLPEDRLQRRAYIAAAAEAMPYANPELGGYEAPVGNIGTSHITRGYQRALRVHRRLLPAFEHGDWRAEIERKRPITKTSTGGGAQGSEAAELAAKLRDGNAHVPANNRIVDRLVEIGRPSIAPLVAQIRDRDGESRGYSAWALANVLIGVTPQPEEAMSALVEATRDADGYVVALSRSGLGKLRSATAENDRAGEEAAAELPRSVTRLVALLEDGNAHRVFNNRVVDRLEECGKTAIPSLVAAVNDESFPGRGYAAWALSQVLKVTESRDEVALAALRAATESDDPYVATLARSGLSTL
ncbi:MAG: hypothetical protein NXI31_21835 [bacterium]|nr:hypothetical protein [bacterium]